MSGYWGLTGFLDNGAYWDPRLPNGSADDDWLAEQGITPADIDQVATDMGIYERLPGAAGLEPSPEYEHARQSRIARGAEHACAACGCSETRACPGGCIWATERLCSRCVGGAR